MVEYVPPCSWWHVSISGTTFHRLSHAFDALLAELPTVREGGIDAAEFRGSASDARSRLGTHAFAQARTQHRTDTVPVGRSWPVLLIRQPAVGGGCCTFAVLGPCRVRERTVSEAAAMIPGGTEPSGF